MLPLTLIPSIVNAGVGLWETFGASSAIDKLKKMQMPNYSVSPELQGAYDDAQTMAQRGFAPEQKAAFRYNLSQDINTKLQKAKDTSGGNLARVISGIGNINTQDAENKFATQDALLKDAHIKYAGVLANSIQHQKNLATQADIHHRLLLENSAGQGLKTGINNIGGALNFGALMLNGGGGKAGGSGFDLTSLLGGGSSKNPIMGGVGGSGTDTINQSEDQFNIPQTLEG